MYLIEAAVVNATHSGPGGAGDVAILNAAARTRGVVAPRVRNRRRKS